MLRFLESPDFQPSLAKKYIDQKFVLQVSFIEKIEIDVITNYFIIANALDQYITLLENLYS